SSGGTTVGSNVLGYTQSATLPMEIAIQAKLRQGRLSWAHGQLASDHGAASRGGSTGVEGNRELLSCFGKHLVDSFFRHTQGASDTFPWFAVQQFFDHGAFLSGEVACSVMQARS